MESETTPIYAYRRFAPTGLMLGNVLTGCSVLAPAGMLSELSTGLDVPIREAGPLLPFGAVVLCIASPLSAWLTSRIERRTLLAATLAVLALTNIASAFAPDYATLLVIRLIMLAVGALYTPQAAGTAALIVPAEKRGSTIAYIFVGWSLAAAVALPLITLVASRDGWRAAYGSIGSIGCLSCLLLAWRLPGGLVGSPVDLKTWADVGRSRMIILLLSITTLQMSGQFVVLTFMGPLLTKLTNAGPDAVALVFALYGVFGFIGIDRDPHCRFLGRLQDIGVVHLCDADRHHRMGGDRGQLSVDGLRGCDLGAGFRLDQLDATGQARECGAGACVSIGLAQHVS